MPRKVTVPEASPAEIEIFQRSFESLEKGNTLTCPSPLPQARNPNGKKSKWGGSKCFKLFLPSHRGAYTAHAMKAHGIPQSATTAGGWICDLRHPVTKIQCGYRFGREDHLKRHKSGKVCLAYVDKANHLIGCAQVFDDGRVCGRSFKQPKLYRRHLLSRDHGGPGARAVAAARKEMGKHARREDRSSADLRDMEEEVDNPDDMDVDEALAKDHNVAAKDVQQDQIQNSVVDDKFSRFQGIDHLGTLLDQLETLLDQMGTKLVR